MTTEEMFTWPEGVLAGLRLQKRIAEIDVEVAALHRDGYGTDADRLLDERTELQAFVDPSI